MIWIYRALVFIAASVLAIYCKEHAHTLMYWFMLLAVFVSLFTGPTTLTN